MTVVYAPGVTVTDHVGATVKIGDVSDPHAVTVRTLAPLKMPQDPFTRWADSIRAQQKIYRDLTSTPLLKQFPVFDAAKKTEPPEGGNRERELVFRTVVALEKAFAELPQGHAQVAGFLHGKGFKGDTKAEGNALAVYLASEAKRRIERENLGMTLSPEVTIWVESNGTIVESKNYQVAMEPQIWQNMFIGLLRAGQYPALVW